MEDPIAFLFECPVCFDPIIPPFNQCISGHLLCHDCIPRLNKCPICRVRINPKKRIRNLQLENTAREHTYSCTFKILGCEAILKLDDIENHKFDCRFSLLGYCSKIGIPRCKIQTTSCDIVCHLQEKHEIPSLSLDSGKIEILQVGNLSSAYEISKHYWNPVILSHQNQTFCLLTSTKNGEISWRVVSLGSKEKVKHFSTTITLLAQPEQKQSLQWKGQVGSIQSISGELPQFSIPIQVLSRFAQKTEDAENFWWSRREKSNEKEWKLQIGLEGNGKRSENLARETPTTYNEAREVDCDCDDACSCNLPSCCCCGIGFADDISYRCIKCESYVLCKACTDSGVHSQHLFFRIPRKRTFSEVVVTIKTRSEYYVPTFALTLPTLTNLPEAEDLDSDDD